MVCHNYHIIKVESYLTRPLCRSSWHPAVCVTWVSSTSRALIRSSSRNSTASDEAHGRFPACNFFTSTGYRSLEWRTQSVTTIRCFEYFLKHLHICHWHCIVTHCILTTAAAYCQQLKKRKWMVTLTCKDCKPVRSQQQLRTTSKPLYCSEELHLLPATSLMAPQPQNVTKGPSLLESLAKRHRLIRAILWL